MTNHLEQALQTAAQSVAEKLADSSTRLVFAESCTSGLLAAMLARIPGISQHFCGSFVTYRESLKIDALGVSAQTLQRHSAVSTPTTREMVAGALERCSEATVALAITGHLGPNAPADLDGVVFVACQVRGDDLPTERRLQLESFLRVDRQYEAAVAAFDELHAFLNTLSSR